MRKEKPIEYDECGSVGVLERGADDALFFSPGDDFDDGVLALMHPLRGRAAPLLPSIGRGGA